MGWSGKMVQRRQLANTRFAFTDVANCCSKHVLTQHHRCVLPAYICIHCVLRAWSDRAESVVVSCVQPTAHDDAMVHLLVQSSVMQCGILALSGLIFWLSRSNESSDYSLL